MTTSADARLSHLSTRWPWLAAAHAGPREDARDAQARLVERYRPAVERYLRAAVRDPHAADDLFQEFALRLARGAFRNVRPDRGRFRDFLRTVLIRLVIDHRRRAGAAPACGLPAAAASPEPDDDRVLWDAWRAELFERAWGSLREEEGRTGRPLHTLLRLRADDPGATSEALSAALEARGARPLGPVGVRRALMDARSRFTDRIVAEVAASLARPSALDAADELADLGLLEACRDAVTRRWPGG